MRQRVLEWTDPGETLAAAEASSGVDFLKALASGEVPGAPMAMLMNLRLASVDPGHVVFEGTPGEEHYNPHGTVHGGWAATIFDTALGCAVHASLARGHAYTTLELHVNFVRAITHGTGALRCEARVLHKGGRVATAQATLTDGDGALYGHATTTCLLFERRPRADR